MRSERLDVGFVSCQDSAARLGERDDEGVDGRAGSRAPPELGRSPGDGGRDLGLDDAGLEKPVHVGISRRVAVKRLDEHHRRHDGRPEPAATKERMSASAGLVRDDSLVTPPLSRMSMSANPAEASIADPAGDGVGMCALTDGRLAHLAGELFQVHGCLVEGILTFELGAECDLQEF